MSCYVTYRHVWKSSVEVVAGGTVVVCCDDAS